MSPLKRSNGNDPRWYKDAIIYELHVRTFFDGNNDGVGDFPGLIQKLDYLQTLASRACGCCPSSHRRCATTDMTLPTTRVSTPATERWKTSRRSLKQHTSESCRS